MNASNHVEQAVARLNVATRAVLDERILANAAAALERATTGVRQPARSRVRHATFDNRAVRWAAVIAVTGVVVAGGVAVWKRSVDRTQTVVQVPPQTSPNVPSQASLRAAQQRKIDALSAAGDVNGLIEALDTSRIEDRIRAARYLGEIADPRAIAALSPLAAQWQGDPAENPFAEAIRQIEARTRPEEPNGPDNRQSLKTSSVPGAKLERVLVGTITDAETGEPIPGVTLQLISYASYTATTDSNGVYGFDRVDKDGLYYIRLNAPEYITAAEWEQPWETVRLRTGEQVVRDYALERGGKLLITTIDESGRTIKGVDVYAVYVSDEMGRGPKHQPSRSDANGVVVIDGLRADTYLVMAVHPDYALAGGKVSLDKPKQVKSVVLSLQPGVSVTGVATCSDGLPPSGWRIEAQPLWWNSVISWPRGGPVAEDGTFLLQHILPGPHRLEVLIPEKGGRTRGVWLADVNLPPESGLLDVKIPLPSPQSRASPSKG
jgi:hypothetical protein